MRFKSMQDDLVHLRDVAGAYGEDDVAMMRAHHHHLGRGVHVFDATDPVLCRFMLKLERLVHDGGRSHVGEILLLLARGEDAGNDDVIGLGKRLREFRAEETRAGEQVRLEDKEDFFVDGLSRGMKQRLCLSRALIHDPDLLILDEPASGLDPRTRVEYTAILKELRDQGKTLLVSSHILSELSELCTSIGIIEQGRTVLQGSMDQIFARINSSNPLLISIFSQKEKALAILKSHPCVQTIAVQGDEIKLGFLGDRQDEALLLQQLIDADVMVSSFMREKGSLESLFMQITGHEEERAVLKHEMESGI